MDPNFQSLRITIVLAAQRGNFTRKPSHGLPHSPYEHPDWLRRLLEEQKPTQ
jgi:hypothetical protein